MSEVALLIMLQDLLTVGLIVHVCLAVRQAFGPSAVRTVIPVLPVVVLLWGALWSYVPLLSEARLSPPPFGQAAVVLASLTVFSLAWLSPLIKISSPDFDHHPLLGMAIWRMVFGTSVLAVGVGGGLPPSFYWSVGLGDLVVGLVGGALLLGGKPVSKNLFRHWNALGLADLIHVLILGAVTLVPFYVAHPETPLTNLLPLTGVPLLMSLHILGLRRI